MRSFLVACLLAGCYQPTTESCYYRCAAGANPCPSGLECSAGMCATRGTSCLATGDGVGSDAVSDSLPGIDAPAAMCGNGTATVGEICYGMPMPFSTPGTPVDGFLGDYDGDSDLDLIYLSTDNPGNVRVHFQSLGVFSSSLPGPPLTNPTFLRAANLAPSTLALELIVGSNSSIQTFGYTTGGPVLISTLNDSTVGGNAVVAGITNNGTTPDVVTASTTTVSVYQYNATTLALTRRDSVPGGASELTAGRLNADLFADIAFGGASGITMATGGSSGFPDPRISVTGTRVDDLEIGDINGGGANDIVFVVNDTGPGMPGKIGVMLGNGDGSFAAPSITSVVNLANVMALRDIDGDGLQDVIAVRTGTNRSLLIFRGRSDGQLEPAVAFSLPGLSAQLSVKGDYNNDSVPDIVVTDSLSRTIYVFPSNP